MLTVPQGYLAYLSSRHLKRCSRLSHLVLALLRDGQRKVRRGARLRLILGEEGVPQRLPRGGPLVRPQHQQLQQEVHCVGGRRGQDGTQLDRLLRLELHVVWEGAVLLSGVQ